MSEQDIMTEAGWTAAVEAMRTAGKRQGERDAAWLCDGNTTQEAAKALLARCEACELDYSPPFDGEEGDAWADVVMQEETNVLVTCLDAHERHELTSAFEDGYSEGYCHEAERLARFYLAD